MNYKSILVFLWLCTTVYSQETKHPAYLTTIDGILKEVYAMVSRKEGEVKDWDTFRNLFLPSVRFTVRNHSDIITAPVESVSLEEIIELMQDEYYEKGFTQYEIAKQVDEFNDIAQVFQSFYGKDSEGYESRGICSFQLVNYDDRWWIVNVLWTSETEDHQIPAKYLKN